MAHSSLLSVHPFVDTAATVIITVTSITPTTIVVAITESTAANAETLTYTVTVNNSEQVEVTGSTAFEIALSSPLTFTPMGLNFLQALNFMHSRIF